MKEGLKKLPKHILECQTHSRQVPKELAELQDYLKQLSGYAEKYNRVTKSIARQGIPAKETSFSVKEDVATRTGVEIIVLPQPEPITVISPPEDSDVDSNSSDIGIYYIDDVKPVNLINVIERELCLVKELFPSVGGIADEMKNEFDHFKVCCSCLKKVSPLLPDILKELQELIKFIRRKRNEAYTWPNDSEYLRKSIEGFTKPFKKDDQDPKKVKRREETIGFVTVHTKTPSILSHVESSIMGERTTCCVRLTNRPQLSVFRSETQNDLRFIEKMETVERVDETMEGSGEREESYLTEFSTAQALRILHPIPTLERAVQMNTTGEVTHTIVDGCADEVSCEELENPLAIQAKEFLMTAKAALAEACSSLGRRDEMVMETDLKMPFTKSAVDEMPTEREVNPSYGRSTKSDDGSISLIPSKWSEEDGEAGIPIPLRSVRGLSELNTGHKLLKDLESEANTVTQHRDELESATINLTIKIGGEEVLSQYHSAMSVITSGTDFMGPTCVEQFEKDAVHRKRSFTGQALQFRVPVTFNESEVTHVSKTSNEVSIKPTAESESDTSTLYPQITVQCEHNLTMQKLRCRLRFLEESLRSLTRTIDRMDILTDKLSEDAYESNENFKDMANRYRFISNLLWS